MTKEDKRAEAGTQNWLRTATLLLTILSPIINSMASRLADRLEQGGKRIKEVKVDVPGAVQEKVVAAQQSIGDTLYELKDHPYSQELLKRGESLAEELQDLVERGSQLSQSLLAHSSDITSDLAERGGKASQELVKRSEEARKELRKRTHQAARQGGLFWTIAGFSIGLTVAGITAYLLIRQRIRQQREEEQSFQVPQNSVNTTASSTASTPPTAQTAPAQAEEEAPAIAVQEDSVPADAAFVGVVGTHRYYPASTPLDQLSGNGKVDVVYFSSEDEAK